MSTTTASKTLYTTGEITETHRKVMWRILPFLMCCWIICQMDRSNIGIAKLGFMKDLGFSEAAFGFGAGIFYLTYVIVELPSNLYLQKFGVRQTLLRIMILWGLCVFPFAWMKSANQFYIYRLLLGIGEGGFFPGVLLYISYWVPAARKARFTALFMASIPLGGFISSPINGAIMRNMHGIWGYKGWQWIFLLEGIPAIALGIMSWYYLADRPKDARWLSDKQKAILQADLDEDERKKALRKANKSKLSDAIKEPKVWILVAVSYLLQHSSSAIGNWLPTFIRNTGIKDVFYIGLIAAIPYLLSVIAQFLVAQHSDKKQERRWHVAICFFTAALGWAILPFVSKDPVVAIVVITVACVGSYALMGPFWTMPTALLSGNAAAAGLGLVTGIGALGNLVQPMVVGWIATHTGSFRWGQWFLAAVMLIGGSLILLVKTGDAKKGTA